MSEYFTYDVFLSHSSKDKAIIRPLAEKLRADGVRVWYDEWEIRPGDSIPAKIEEGLEQSRVLVLCMSANAFGSDWAQLESGTFRFRDPLNKGRRFLPLKLDDTKPKGSLAQFLYIDWRVAARQQEYGKLLAACSQPKTELTPEMEIARHRLQQKIFSLGHTGAIRSVAFSPDGLRALSGSDDNTVRLWEVATGRAERVLEGHSGSVYSVAFSPDGSLALSGSEDHTVRLWVVATGRPVRVLEGHSDNVWSVAFSPDGSLALSGSVDNTLRLWEVATGSVVGVLEGHSARVWSVAFSPDGNLALSGSADNTVRLWEVATGRPVRVLEGHSARVLSVAFSPDGSLALSGSEDKTVRLWEVATGRPVRVLEGHSASVRSVAFSPDGRQAFSAAINGVMRVWNLDAPTETKVEPQTQYTNAKVLLVGDSGAGKTGLSMRLALDTWEPSDSTVGAWATHLKLPISAAEDIEREIWLWDFGGQADQRLIHQLYMEDTALAVLVFDGQKEDLFESLGQWDRDLTRSSRKPFIKLLASGRADAGGLRVSRVEVEKFARERGFRSPLFETSSKVGTGCHELKRAIIAGIQWEKIEWRSSPVLFKRLKEEIILLKDEGRVLMRFNELRDALRLRLSGEEANFKDGELKAVVSLLAGPGVVWELKFGSWVLLQPERINAYAQAVIQTLRKDEHELGSIPEEKVLRGNLSYESSVARLEDAEEERIVLLAMHQALVERGLCLREHSEHGTFLIFPSYYGRERPEFVGNPSVLVSFQFSGFLDDIYATLVVRLHHTKPFDQDKLWRYAADFKTLTGKQLGVKLTRRAEGSGELEVYFDPEIGMDLRIIFSKYVHDHLLEKSAEVVRLRHYVCPHCGTTVGNREVAMERLHDWLEGMRLATTFGPLRQFNLAHPRAAVLSSAFCSDLL